MVLLTDIMQILDNEKRSLDIIEINVTPNSKI